MGQAPTGRDERRPTAISPSQLVERPEQQTPSLRRRQAFAAEDRWVGYVNSTPGEWSGWHHHGDNDTYFYVLRGELEFEYGIDGQTLRFGSGDFAHMPANLVHRERTRTGEPGEVVLVQIGHGPTVVNVDDARVDARAD